MFEYLPKEKNTLPYAKELRREMTREERELWFQYLRHYPVKFYKQRPIGPFIVDFYCHKARLVVELDGSQHCDEAGLAYDAKRTAYLETLGIKVLRIPNNEVTRNLRGVCEAVDAEVRARIW